MANPLGIIARDTWNTVSPIRCAGCGRPDVRCCAACEAHLAPRVHHPTLAIRRALFDVPVIAGLHYSGVAKNVLIAYKERGETGVARLLAAPLRSAMWRLSHQTSLAGVSVVCVPHSRAGWVRRGRHPTRALVAKAGWAKALAPAHVLRPALSVQMHGDWSSQKSRSRRERLSAPPEFVAGRELAGRRVVVVDDVLTTGISLEYAARAVTLRGGIVVGAVVVAATPQQGGNASM